MSKTKAYFDELLKLLLMEKQEDYVQFKEIIQSLPLKERKEKGYSWYPLEVLKTGYTYGERAFVEVARSKDNKEPHLFRPGKIAQLFTQQPKVNRPELGGVIHFVDKNKMKIILNSKDLPDWLSGGLIGVDLMFDDRTYVEMEKALKDVMEASGNRLAELRDVILGHQKIYSIPTSTPTLPSLNDSQNKAVQNILSSQDFAIIHGPPGTGKTTTLIQTIKLLCKTENQVLVCTPSNTAADLITERSAAVGLNVVRIGNISRVDENIIQHTLDQRLANHPESKTIKKVKIQAAECRRKAKRFKRSFGWEEKQERNVLYAEARELASWANTLEDRLIDQILSAAQVVACTFVGSTQKVLRNSNFRTVLIDEAAQALEPATWIPICKASKVVLVGDPFQLPPTVKSNKAAKLGFNKTLIEKALDYHPEVNLLNTQYRMNKVIMGFSNSMFYDDKLIAAEEVSNHQLTPETTHPLEFIDTAGCGFDEKVNAKFKSRYNPDEYNILREHLYQLLDQMGEAETPSIAIISPYREQALFIRREIKSDERLAELKISADTIDGFQGQEKEVVYISLVRSNEKGEIGFLKDYRRMNVALTRAQKKLVVIGDSATIGQDNFYSKFLDYCEKEDAYKSAWEFMQ